MNAKFLAALKSYWPRPQNLVIVGLILGISGLVLLSDYINPLPTKAAAIAPNITRFQPYGESVSIRSSLDWALSVTDEQLAQTRSLDLLAADDYVHPIGRLKFLKFLSLAGIRPSPELGEEIRSLAHLQALRLMIHELPEGLLADLGTRLRGLEINAPLLLRQREELPQLTELKFLRVYGSSLTAELAQAIATIPHLETLVIDRQSSYSAAFITPRKPGSELPPEKSAAILQPLRDHPTLKLVYNHWGAQGEPDPAFLKPVWAIPMGSSPVMMGALLRGQLLVLAFLLLIVPQLDTILRQPNSLLIPGYLQAHRLTAVCLLGIGIFWSLLLLVRGGIDWLSAGSLVLLIPTILAATLLLTKWYRGYQSLDAPTGILVLIVCMSLIFSLSALPLPVVAVYLYFLQGNLPFWAGAVLVLELGILLLMLQNFSWWPRYLNEHFATLPQPVSAWNLRRQQEAALLHSKNWQFRWFDIPEKKLRDYSDSMFRQIWLLRKGNAYRPLLLLLLLIVLIPVIFIGLLIMWGVRLQALPINMGPGGNPLLALFLTQAAILMLGVPVIHWFNRCASLQREFLQPVSRKNLVRQLFAGLLLDQSPVLLLGMLAVVFYVSLGFEKPEKIGFLPKLRYLPPALALLLWLMAVSTTVIAFRKKWVVILVLVLLAFLPFYVTQVLVGLALTYARIPGTPSQTYYDWVVEDPVTLFLMAVGLTALSLGVLYGMYRRALRREWG